MVNEVVNTVYQAASVIRRPAKVMIFRGSHQVPVKVENSFCIIVCRNALHLFGMEEPFFVEITFFLPEERPTGRFSESADGEKPHISCWLSGLTLAVASLGAHVAQSRRDWALSVSERRTYAKRLAADPRRSRGLTTELPFSLPATARQPPARPPGRGGHSTVWERFLDGNNGVTAGTDPRFSSAQRSRCKNPRFLLNAVASSTLSGQRPMG